MPILVYQITENLEKRSSDREVRFFRSRVSFVYGENPLSLSEICWRSGVPIEDEREGESRSLGTGRGKYSPPASPERVTPKVLKRRDKGFSHKNIF